MLELKTTADAKKCVALVTKYGLQDRTLYMSFDKSKLKAVRKLLPNARLDKSMIALMIAMDLSILYAVLSDPGERELERMFRLLMAAAALFAVYIIAVFLFPGLYWDGIRQYLSEDAVRVNDALLQQRYGVSLGGNVVFADYFMFFGVTIAVNLLFARRNTLRQRFAYLMVAFLCLAGIILVNRKSELLATVLTLGVIYLSRLNFTTLDNRRRGTRLMILVLALLAAAAVVFLKMGFLQRYVSFAGRVRDNAATGQTADVSSGRLTLWIRAIRLFAGSPIVGIGWGRFSDHVADTFNVFSGAQLNNVHNNYLQLLCENGIIGFILVMTPMVYLFARTRQRARYLRRRGQSGTAAGIAAVTSLAFQIYAFTLSLIDPCWYKMIFWCLYSIAVIFAAGPDTAEARHETA